MDQVRVWVRAVSSDEPITMKFAKNDLVADVIRDTAMFEKLEAQLSRLKLTYHEDVKKFIDEEKKVGDVVSLNYISEKTPLLLTEVKGQTSPGMIYETPSSISRNWQRYQNEYNIQFHYPPDPRTSSPHAAVYFEPFSDFMESLSILPTRMSSGRSRSDSLAIASDVVEQMSKIYTNNEGDRQNKLMEILCKKFELRTYSCSVSSKRLIKSNMAITHEGKIALANFGDFDFVEGGESANFQQAGYYLHFSTEITSKLNRLDLAPMLLVSIVGNGYVQAFAGYRNESGQPCIDPISQPLFMAYVPLNTLGFVDTLAYFLDSVHNLVEALKAYYREAFICGHVNTGYPYFCDAGLVYKRRICRRVFHAIYNGSDVIVKFIYRRYGFEVHEHLASVGLAPEIICFEELKCGWHVLVMKYISNYTEYSIFDLSKDRRKEKAEEILNALAIKNFVHGDLRCPNLALCGDDTTGDIVVLDFDWSGAEGDEHVVYPDDLNTIDIAWPEGVKRGAKISKAHDRSMILKELKLFDS